MFNKTDLINIIKRHNISNENIKDKDLNDKIIKEIYELCKKNKYQIHQDLIPYTQELLSLYPHLNTKECEEYHLNTCKNTFKIMKNNNFKIRRKKIAKLLGYILIDLDVLKII